MADPITYKRFVHGSLVVPPFSIGGGEAICLHVPNSAIRDAYTLPAVLSGEEQIEELTVQGVAVYARRPMGRRRLWALWSNPTILDWLMQAAHLSQSRAMELLAQHGQSPRTRVGLLGNPQRFHLGIAAALARQPDALIFDGFGESLRAIDKAFQEIDTRRENIATVYLSFPAGRQRMCLPRARCLTMTADRTKQPDAA